MTTTDIARGDDWDEHWRKLGAESERNPGVLYRARLIGGLLEAGGPPERVLDIGAGVGDFLLHASRRWPQAELAGVDVSAEAARIASARVPGATCEVADLTAGAPTSDALHGWATHAVCSEVLEHLDEPVALLRNCQVMLAPGVRFVITVPAGPMTAFARHLGHRRHYTPELLREQVEEAGLVVERIDRAGWPFFNLYQAAAKARGDKLIADAGGETGEPSALARAGMAVFRALFHANLPRSPWGHQLVAVVTTPRS